MDREELLFVAVVMATAMAMLLGSFSYSSDAQTFPQAAAVLTLLFGLAVLINDRYDVLAESEADIIGQVADTGELDDIALDSETIEDAAAEGQTTTDDSQSEKTGTDGPPAGQMASEHAGATQTSGASPAGADVDTAQSRVTLPEPGEFRINNPVVAVEVPFLDRTITHRATVAVMLVVYFALVWLFGVFYASLAFVLLYAKVVGLRRRTTALLTVFVVLSLWFFGAYLETPLFRPEHDWFVVLELEP